MGLFDDEDENKSYSVKEIKELLARDELEKAKTNSDLNNRISNLEMLLKGLGDGTLLGDPSAASYERPLGPGDQGYVDPTQTSGTSKPEAYNQFPFKYPKPNPVMPHINNSGPSP